MKLGIAVAWFINFLKHQSHQQLSSCVSLSCDCCECMVLMGCQNAVEGCGPARQCALVYLYVCICLYILRTPCITFSDVTFPALSLCHPSIMSCTYEWARLVLQYINAFIASYYSMLTGYFVKIVGYSHYKYDQMSKPKHTGQVADSQQPQYWTVSLGKTTKHWQCRFNHRSNGPMAWGQGHSWPGGSRGPDPPSSDQTNP